MTTTLSVSLLCSVLAGVSNADPSPFRSSVTDPPKVDYSKLKPLGKSGRLDSTGSSPAYVGSSSGRDEFFRGALDDIRIYRTALDSKQIEALGAGRDISPREDLSLQLSFDGTLADSVRPDTKLRMLGAEPTFADGKLGKALVLDGQGQSVRIDHRAGLKPTTGKITLCAWIRPTKLGDDWQEIYRKEDASARQLLALGKTGFFGLWLGLGIDGGYVERGARLDPKTLADGQWHHVAASYDGRFMRFYRDGKLLAQQDVLGNQAPNPLLPTDPKDKRPRVAFLGGSLVHRMAEFGYVETELTRLCPENDIVFRNLGWPGDDVQGRARAEFGPGEKNRSGWRRPSNEMGDYGFRKMIDQIRLERPHVLLVGYGSEAAFDDNALSSFEKGLTRLLDTLEPTGVKVILMTPPPRPGQQAHFKVQNKRLERVAEALKKIAAKRSLTCVDLFTAWGKPDNAAKLSDNGIHLNANGYRRLAGILARELGLTSPAWSVTLDRNGKATSAEGTKVTATKRTEFGFLTTLEDGRLPSVSTDAERKLTISGLGKGHYALDCDGRRIRHADSGAWAKGVTIAHGPEFEQLERLRQKILEKNRVHFYGFRPQNKAYIHLFRRHERGHHTGELERFALLVREAEEEIARLRQPRARYLELVREKDYPDHEVPKGDTKPNPAEEVKAFTIPEGFQIELFASDPMIANPININWDERGRMWVATSTIYPHLRPGQTPNDKIIILEDIDKDGRADKSTVFADDLLVPQSVIPGRGGVYVTQSTDLLFLQDTDGDDKADKRTTLLTGFGNADVHHMIHALRWGPDGDLYFEQSIYINSVVETPWGIRKCDGSCVWKLRPESLRLETLSRGLVNPWGFAFDDWGQSFATDGAGGGGLSYIFPGSAFKTHGQYARELPTMNPGRPKECGLEWLSGRHLPEDWRDTFLTNDFRANRVTRYRLKENGSGYSSQFLGDVVSSKHRAFRPVDVKVGPDGAIYIVDWYNLIIDHGEVDFHHPLRDKRHGRIWRMTRKGSPLVKPPKLAGATPTQLLDALKTPEQWTRTQARRLLQESDPKTVLPALERWLTALDPNDPREQRHRLEALWVCQGLRTVDAKLLKSVLGSTNHHVRAAAVRVLADWRESIPDAYELLANAVVDSHPRVRLEAVNALRESASLKGASIALRALNAPLDTNLDFALWRTARTLSPQWLPALQAGKKVFDGRPDRIAFALTATGKRDGLAPLVDLVRQKKLATDQEVEALRVLGVLGDNNVRSLVVERLLDMPKIRQEPVLASLLDSPRNGRPANAKELVRFLKADDASLRRLAIRLSGRWQIREALPLLEALASSQKTNPTDRQHSARAVVAIDPPTGKQRLDKILTATKSPSVTASTLAAWASLDVADASKRALDFLAKSPDREQAAQIFEAILSQRGGRESLAKAVTSTKLPEGVAAEGVRVARESGLDVSALIAAFVKSGGLRQVTKNLSESDIAKLLTAVRERGDPHRGEKVFRRAELNCVGCHALGGAGGEVGPDLSSLGGSTQLGDLLQSVISPSAKIKEGFGTMHMVLGNGQVHVGIVTRRTPNSIQIRTAKNELVTVRKDEVDETLASKVSLMPDGVATQLREDELSDLVSYLSALGRADAFRVPATDYIREWHVLPTTPELAKRLASVGDARVLSEGGSDLLWTSRYSTVRGGLPATELPAFTVNRTRYGYVRFATPPGADVLRIANATGVSRLDKGRWLPVGDAGRIRVEGQRYVTLRIELTEGREDLLIEQTK